MGNILDLVRPETAFDPETVAVIASALEEAWDRLCQSGSECTRPAYARAMREVGEAHHRDEATRHQESERACRRCGAISGGQLSTSGQRTAPQRIRGHGCSICACQRPPADDGKPAAAALTFP